MQLDRFREQLNDSYSWPSLYMFKFIVPAGKEQEVKNLFPKHDVAERPSKNGNYVSVTAEIMAGSSDQVIDIYEAASNIKGLIAL